MSGESLFEVRQYSTARDGDEFMFEQKCIRPSARTLKKVFISKIFLSVSETSYENYLFVTLSLYLPLYFPLSFSLSLSLSLFCFKINRILIIYLQTNNKSNTDNPCVGVAGS